jgi:hypothetical protein
MGYADWYQSTTVTDGGSFKPTPEELEEARKSATDARCVQLFGPVLAILGTVLWAYGDLAANAVMKHLRYRDLAPMHSFGERKAT